MANFLSERVKRIWNAFTNRDPPEQYEYTPRPAGSFLNSSVPYHPVVGPRSEQSVISALINRIAVDCSMIDIRHIKLDENGRYAEDVNDYLNRCLTLSANIDQTNRAFIVDLVVTLLSKGVVASAPIETDGDPRYSSEYKIYSLRNAPISEWHSNYVVLDAYDERDGQHKPLKMLKERVAIIENPFWEIMNEPNSLAQRLLDKIALLDRIDRMSGSGKMNLIIQVPYGVKSKLSQDRAEDRRKEIEDQLANNKYGVAYIDSTEHVIQLNRPLENGLAAQIKDLTDQLYSEIGFSRAILDGTANEDTMTHYEKRIVEPIMAAITTSYTRAFLTDESYNNGHRIAYFNNPFRLIPASQVAELSDKLTRNEIMSSNEIRQMLGFKPVKNAKADELRNKNLNVEADQTFANTNETTESEDLGQNGQ